MVGSSTAVGSRTAGRRAAPRPPRVLVPVLVLLATVVAATSSVGVPLVPAVAALHDVPLHVAQWVVTLPLLVGAVATPVTGRLADGPHRRTVVLAALGVVVAGGVLTALPLSIGWLLAGRVLQGFGLGLMPLLIATARDALPGDRSRKTIGALSITVVSGVGLGYPLAGLVAELGGVRASFWAATGICAFALVAAALVLPPPSPTPARRFDVPGALLLCAGLGGAVLALSEGETWGWSSPRLLAVAGGSLLAMAAWVAVALRVRAPLIDLRLAHGRLPATGHAAMFLMGTANYLVLSSVTLLAQAPVDTGYGFGASVLVAGLVLLPFSLAGMGAGPLSRRLADRAGVRAVLPLCALVLGTASVGFGLLRGSLWELFVVMGVAGLGVSGAFAAAPGLVVAAVPPSETGSAMALNQVLRYAGFCVGSALSAAILNAATPAGRTLPAAGGYTVIGLVACGVCLLTAVLTWVLPGRAGRGAGRAGAVPGSPGR
ncbi:MFS transporter [Geodermatophilus sp. SYSU D00697]